MEGGLLHLPAWRQSLDGLISWIGEKTFESKVDQKDRLALRNEIEKEMREQGMNPRSLDFNRRAEKRFKMAAAALVREEEDKVRDAVRVLSRLPWMAVDSSTARSGITWRIVLKLASSGR